MSTKNKQEISVPEADMETKVEQSEKSSANTPKYSQEELLAIFDSIMFEGEYREDVTIKGKLKVTFKTRSAADTSAISRELDSKQFNLISTVHEYRAMLSMGYSITGYGNKDLSGLVFSKRIEFLEKLPSVVVSAISNALVEFDIKTEAALREQESF